MREGGDQPAFVQLQELSGCCCRCCFFTSFESLFHLMNDSKSKPFLWHPVANLNVSVAEFSESPLKWRTLGLGMMATFDAWTFHDFDADICWPWSSRLLSFSLHAMELGSLAPWPWHGRRSCSKSLTPSGSHAKKIAKFTNHRKTNTIVKDCKGQTKANRFFLLCLSYCCVGNGGMIHGPATVAMGFGSSQLVEGLGSTSVTMTWLGNRTMVVLRPCFFGRPHHDQSSKMYQICDRIIVFRI